MMDENDKMVLLTGLSTTEQQILEHLYTYTIKEKNDSPDARTFYVYCRRQGWIDLPKLKTIEQNLQELGEYEMVEAIPPMGRGCPYPRKYKFDIDPATYEKERGRQ